MDLSKFEKKGEKSKLGETGIYILLTVTSMINDLKTQIVNRIVKKTLNWNVACGFYTTQAGSATQEILDNNIKLGDTPMVSLVKAGVAPVTLGDYEVQEGKIVVTMSADPGADHELNYLILRHSK